MPRKLFYPLILTFLLSLTLFSGSCSEKQYELTTSVEPAGAGSVSPGGTYESGSTVRVTATPGEGYIFEQWGGDASGTSLTQNIVMDSDKSITAHFSGKGPVPVTATKYNVTINIEPAGAGTVTPSGGMYEDNTVLNIRAIPGPGYSYVSWSGDASGNTSSVTVLVDRNKTITAHFVTEPVTVESDGFVLTTFVNPERGGVIIPSGGTFAPGDNVTLTAMPAEGYLFRHWSGGISGRKDTVTITMDGNKNLVANFEEIGRLILSSNGFVNNGRIPVTYSCYGSDYSPELTWSGVPFGTISFALILEDPDAPSGMFTHWVIYNIPANVRTLQENIPEQQELSDGTLQGFNDFGNFGYGGPCPPIGYLHHYNFMLYALDSNVSLPPYAVTRESFLDAIRDHILELAQLSGYFQQD